MDELNKALRGFLDTTEKDYDRILDPTSYPTKEEMGEDLREFLGYDPTSVWDRAMMVSQINKLTGEDGWKCEYEDAESVIDPALEHYDSVKDYLMLHIAQRTIKDIFDKDTSADDLNLDFAYVLDNEIFGTGFDDETDDEDSLLDELDDDEDDFDDDEYDLTD